MTEFLKGYAAGANDMEAGRLVKKRGDQTYTRWFVDYPSTHVLAGQTVEVTPVASALTVASREAAEAKLAEEREAGKLEGFQKGLRARDARLAEVEEERDKTEEYAKEGWDWLSEALDALGAKTVFDIKARAASMDRARELAERERDATGDSIASSSFREIVRLLSGVERPGDGPSTEWGEGEAPGRDLP